MKRYIIKLAGCSDDVTIFKVKLSATQRKAVQRICKASVRESRSQCMPVMRIYAQDDEDYEWFEEYIEATRKYWAETEA